MKYSFLDTPPITVCMKEEDKILEIMREIYYNPEKLEPDYFIKKYGKMAWDLFAQFTRPSLCSMHPGNKLKLSPGGVSEYHRMVAERQNQQIAKDNDFIVFFSFPAR